jgi:hypothetical protein
MSTPTVEDTGLKRSLRQRHVTGTMQTMRKMAST